MSVFRPSLIVLIPVLLLCSCGIRDEKSKLEAVRSLIQEYPDSALNVLESVDASRLLTRKAKAEYSRLHILVFNRNSIGLRDFNIIRPALEYYSDKGTQRERMLLYCYTGRILSLNSRYSEAILYYNLALDNMVDDEYVKGQIYSGLMGCYRETFNYAKELDCAIKAYRCFEKAGNARDYRFQLAQAYSDRGFFDKADSIYTSIYAGADSSSAIAIKAIRNQVSNDLKSDAPKVERALKLMEYRLSRSEKLSHIEQYEYAYLLLLSDDRKEEGKLLLSDLMERDAGRVPLDIGSRAAACAGDYETALALSRKQQSENERRTMLRWQSVFDTHVGYYQVLSENAKKKSTIADQRTLIIVIVSFLLMSLSYIFFKSRTLAAKSENDRLINAVEESERLLEEERIKVKEAEKQIGDLSVAKEGYLDRIAGLRASYVSLYQSMFVSIGEHYDPASLFWNDSISDRVKKSLLPELDKLLSEISGRSASQKKFEERLNEGLDDVVRKIREDFPKFGDEDIRFICYMIIGFSNSTISFLMDMSKENVRVKRHRLRSRIRTYAGPNEELYKALF